MDSKDIERLLQKGQEVLDRSRAAQEALDGSMTVLPQADPTELQPAPNAQATDTPNKQKAQTKRPVSKAPPPLRVLSGRSCVPRGPEPTQALIDFPPYYPNHLIPQTTVIIGEAVKRFREQTQVLPLCRYVISALTPVFRNGVQNGTLSANFALSRVGDLIKFLLVHNCDEPSERFRLEQETRKSDEWLKLADEMDAAMTPKRGLSLEERIEQEKNDRLALEIEDLKAQAKALFFSPADSGGPMIAMNLLGGPLRERERQKQESDQRLGELRGQKLESTGPGVGDRKLAHRHVLDKRSPERMKRLTIIRQSLSQEPGFSALELCKRLDFANHPPLEKWCENHCVTTWSAAYRKPALRKAIQAMLSKDKREIKRLAELPSQR